MSDRVGGYRDHPRPGGNKLSSDEPKPGNYTLANPKPGV